MNRFEILAKNPMATLRAVIRTSADQAPIKTINLLYLMAIIAAMKKVLSAISASRIIVKEDTLLVFVSKSTCTVIM